jgi:hypothetical protein
VAEELAQQEVLQKTLYYEQCCLNKHTQFCPCYDDVNINWRGFSEVCMSCLYFGTLKENYIKSEPLSESYDKLVAEVKRMEPQPRTET